MDAREPKQKELLASVIITTYNRRDALRLTLNALGAQTVPGDRYEVMVVDDGSTDDTSTALAELSLPCDLRAFRQSKNCGISAGRNLAIRNARGRFLIFVSDDLIVPENFIATHVSTLERFPGCWVVGGIKQLDSISQSPFGRYLDELESGWEQARKSAPVAANIWEMSWPTARNLSLPRRDLDRTGLFDEQFRMSCEDQDLAHKARAAGIRFLYNAEITCLHNDQVGDLSRFCRAQVPRTRDTALFCAKWADEHGRAPVAQLNGYISSADPASIIFKKAIKSILSARPITPLIEKSIRLLERADAPDAALWPMYRLVIGLYMFRGWREGLKALEQRNGLANAQSIGCHSNV
jgi:GT2 family glycosyltransferase